MATNAVPGKVQSSSPAVYSCFACHRQPSRAGSESDEGSLDRIIWLLGELVKPSASLTDSGLQLSL
jgi:hypothetical protein